VGGVEPLAARPRPNATAALAAQAAALRYDDIPRDVVTVAKQCILDTIGSAIAGSAEPGARMVREIVLHDSGTGGCSLFGLPGVRTSASAAALGNGIAAHALDFDDVLTSFTGHPSAPVLPAAFALAEEGRLTGRALLEAFVTGVESEARIGTAVAPAHYLRGFHATGTIGTFGAAAAGARILGADAGTMEFALGIAGAQAAGLKSQFGTMTKPLHAGKAAADGLLAARLAALGFTSAADIVACPQGFAATAADGLDLDVLAAPFGSPWYLLRTLFKMHASCHYTHSVFESVRSLRPRVTADEVESITLRVHPDLLAACDIHDPATGLAGKFSMRYVAALALVKGQADPGQFTDEAVRNPLLRELSAKVKVTPDPAIPHFTCECVVQAPDGRRYEAAHNTERPAWQHSPDEQTAALTAKFAALAGPVIGQTRTAKLTEAIMNLQDVTDVSDLLAG
jgi:2-methylcitrate dehydratase PrpD